MNKNPPADHWLVERIKSRYQGAPHYKWYQPDLGELSELLRQPVWTLSTWAPKQAEMIGYHSEDIILLVDNTYVGSFAYNAAKIEIASQLLPGEENYKELLIGNLKKFIAEQIWMYNPSTNTARFIIEYLYEFNGRNKKLDASMQQLPNCHDLLQMLKNFIPFLLLLHEVGHIAYSHGHYRSESDEAINNAISKTIGAGHGLPMLAEEVFCDLFGMVNALSVFNSEQGWSIDCLFNIGITALTAALLCVETKQLAINYKSEQIQHIEMSPKKNVLMARAEVVRSAMELSLIDERNKFRDPVRTTHIAMDTLDIRDCWQAACSMPYLDEEISEISLLLAQGFCEAERGGFDHIVRSLNKLSPLHDL